MYVHLLFWCHYQWRSQRCISLLIVYINSYIVNNSTDKSFIFLFFSYNFLCLKQVVEVVRYLLFSDRKKYPIKRGGMWTVQTSTVCVDKVYCNFHIESNVTRLNKNPFNTVYNHFFIWPRPRNNSKVHVVLVHVLVNFPSYLKYCPAFKSWLSSCCTSLVFHLFADITKNVLKEHSRAFNQIFDQAKTTLRKVYT